MRSRDVTTCIDLWQPEFGPQYQGVWDDFSQALSSSLGSEAFRGEIFEELFDDRLQGIRVAGQLDGMVSKGARSNGHATSEYAAKRR
jgi:hypothetical protein